MANKRELETAGSKLWFCTITGAVAGEKKWSESRTYSSGGGGYVHRGSGFVAAPQIKTQVSTRHEFWLKAPDGEERCVQLGNSSVAVREEQILTAIWGARVGKETGPYLLLRNHTAANESWLIHDERTLLKELGLSDPVMQWGFIGGVVALLLFVALRQTGSGSFVVCLFTVLGCLAWGSIQRQATARLLKKAAEAVLSLELEALRPSPRVSFEAPSADPRLPA